MRQKVPEGALGKGTACMSGVVWIEEEPVFDVDAAGVRISYASGNEHYVRRMSRAMYRAMCERGLRALDDYELAERDKRKVVRMGKRAAH